LLEEIFSTVNTLVEMNHGCSEILLKCEVIRLLVYYPTGSPNCAAEK